jgi:hypothetical protein
MEDNRLRTDDASGLKLRQYVDHYSSIAKAEISQVVVLSAGVLVHF